MTREKKIIFRMRGNNNFKGTDRETTVFLVTLWVLRESSAGFFVVFFPGKQTADRAVQEKVKAVSLYKSGKIQQEAFYCKTASLSLKHFQLVA